MRHVWQPWQVSVPTFFRAVCQGAEGVVVVQEPVPARVPSAERFVSHVANWGT